jgi:superfamily II DNA or RNA helicase
MMPDVMFIKEHDAAYLPYGFKSKLLEYLEEMNIEYTINDHIKSMPEPVWDKLDGVELRDGQLECMKAIINHKGGVIQAPPGFGKSFIIVQMCRIFPELRFVICTRAASVVRTLYERFLGIEELKDCTGIYGAGMKKGLGSRIMICTNKSVLNADYRHCDVLFIDEAHGVGSATDADTFACFSSALRYGFSATPKGRSDGADYMLEAICGRVIFSYEFSKAVEAGSVVPIKVIMHRINSECKSVNYKTPVGYVRHGIWFNKDRNRRIAEIARYYMKMGKQVIIMTKTIAHLMQISMLLPEAAVAYSPSSVSPKDFEDYKNIGMMRGERLTGKGLVELQTRIEKGEIPVCICTKIFKEGVDFTGLRVLIRADGESGSIDNYQIPGRLTRLHTDKEEGLLVDFIDEFDDRLMNRSKLRMKSYRKNSFKVIESGGDNNG